MNGYSRWVMLVTAVLFPVASFAFDTLAKVRETQTITIAYRAGQPPFSYVDADNKPIGYSVDLCLKVADAIKRELKLPNLSVQYIPVDSVTRFTSIVEGKAELECGSTTNNAERRKKVAFTIPHFYSGVRALVRANSRIANWPDLRGRTVVTTKNTTTVQLLNERNNVRALNIKLVEGDDDMHSFAQIEKGTADAFPMDDVLLYGFKANAKDPSMFAVVGEPLSVEPYGIMLPKDQPAFKKLVDKEMMRIIDSGEIYKIYDRWFTQPIPPNGRNLRMPMGYLLRDSLRFPSDKVADN